MINRKKEGFTITELLVAMSVFTIVIVVIVGIFIQGLRSQRILNHLMAINDNTALVIEQMAREIRTGYGFCPADQPCSPTILNFTNFQAQPVTFAFNEDGSISRNGVVLTTAEAVISDAQFIFSQDDGDGNPDNNVCNPWRISILMTVRSVQPEITQSSKIQTTVSSRILPIDSPNPSPEVINQCAN